MPRYNLAFDGATTHEMYAYLLLTQAIQPLKKVVTGAHVAAGTAPSGVRPDFDPTLLDEAGIGRPSAQRLSRLRIAFSVDGAVASLHGSGPGCGLTRLVCR